jgi:hypothetical protein
MLNTFARDKNQILFPKVNFSANRNKNNVILRIISKTIQNKDRCKVLKTKHLIKGPVTLSSAILYSLPPGPLGQIQLQFRF